MDLRELSRLERRQRTVESLQRHYDLIQQQKIEAALFAPAVALAMGGRGALKLAPRVGGSSSFLKEEKVFDIRKSQGVEPTALEFLSKEQPWRVRAGQEWKLKIVGRAQKTKTEGHAFRSYREAIIAARDERTKNVFLNRGLRKASGHPIDRLNTRPDVTIVDHEGKVHQIEVPSRTDVERALRQRMEAAQKRLPEVMQGEVDIRQITEVLKQ